MSNDANPENNYGSPLPYGTPPGGYGTGPGIPPPATPLPLGEALRQLPNQYIRIVTKPGAASFAQEQGKAAWNIVWVQLLIITVFSVVASFVIFNVTLPAIYAAMNVPPQSIQVMRSVFTVLPFAYILIVPLSFFIGTGIYHLIAKAFGGRGTFLTYCYSYLLFYVPLSIVSLILSMIPFVNYLTILIAIYQIVLQVFMTMAVHRLSGGRASLAVLILPIVLIVLSCILGLVLGFAIVGAMHRPS